GEAVEHEVAGTRQEAGLETVDLLRHLDRVVTVDPAARLDVNGLSRFELLLEHVAVAVDPQHSLPVAGEKLVDPKAAPIEHVRDPLNAAVVVLDASGRGEELVLADDDPLARLEMERDDVPRGVAAKRELAGRL